MPEDTYKHKGLRTNLVKQLQQKGIGEKAILDAFMAVPRHFFLDTSFLEHAYADKAFGIGEGQTISQPFTVAVQTQLLDMQAGDKILEIGTGSGYQACILLELGARLFTIEYNRKLYEKARKMIESMGYSANVFCGDGSRGLPSYAPFDKIIVTAGAPNIPSALIDQLQIGGRLVIPVGDNKTQQMLRLTKMEDNKVKKESFGNFSFVKLKGEHGW